MTESILVSALLAAFGFSLFSIGVARYSGRIWLAATLGAVGSLAVASVVGLVTGLEWDWSSPFQIGNETLRLHFDAISAWFLILLSVLGGAGAVYASSYWCERDHPRSAKAGRFWWSVLVFTVAAVLVVANGLHFLIAWELFTVAAFCLITLDRQRGEVRAAGWLYLGASHVAALCLFALFATLAVRTGSWALAPMKQHTELQPLFWLALIGFGLKAGVYPLHVWLPSAHANAPSHVSAILSGVTIKVGIYGLVRFSGWLPVPVSAGWVVLFLGLVSAVLGVAFALGQHDLKRLLAYHSVENIGIILIGLGLALVGFSQGDPNWGRLALAGGLLHVWNHGLFKGLLFLGAGSVLHTTGTRQMSLLGGLWSRMPWTAGLFGLGAVAICGLPPLNGFVSEWLIYLGIFDAAQVHGPSSWAAIPAAIMLGVTGALAVACFAKVCGVVFLGAPRTRAAEHAHECDRRMRGAMAVLALGCLAIGLAPVVFWPGLAHCVAAWGGGVVETQSIASLTTLTGVHLALAAAGVLAVVVMRAVLKARRRQRALTWDCGYAAPTARMQYTAGSFAATLTEWFEWVLRPEVHVEAPEGVLAGAARHETHTPESVLKFVIEPSSLGVMRISHWIRQFQHGRVQAYLFYLLLGVALLAALLLV